MKEIFIIAILSSLLFGCAATEVTPVTKGFALVEEEKILWRQSEESQETLKKSDMLYDNPELTAYINVVTVCYGMKWDHHCKEDGWKLHSARLLSAQYIGRS